MAIPSRFDNVIWVAPFIWRDPATDPGPDGKLQCVLPGAERASDAEIAQRRANAALKPKTAQRPCDAGLFSDDASQLKLV